MAQRPGSYFGTPFDDRADSASLKRLANLFELERLHDESVAFAPIRHRTVDVRTEKCGHRLPLLPGRSNVPRCPKRDTGVVRYRRDVHRLPQKSVCRAVEGNTTCKAHLLLSSHSASDIDKSPDAILEGGLCAPRCVNRHLVFV